MLTFSSPDFDDLLVSSIGSTASFEAGPGSIATATHPIAAGLPATFTVATGTHNWQLMGDVLAEGSVTVASFIREISPTAASLADVDAMASNAKQSLKASGTVSTLDFNSNSPGDWDGGNDYPLPAGASPEILGLVARGKLNVTTPGKYSFALGNDDGARLRIDVAKDGLTAACTRADPTGGRNLHMATQLRSSLKARTDLSEREADEIIRKARPAFRDGIYGRLALPELPDGLAA